MTSTREEMQHAEQLALLQAAAVIFVATPSGLNTSEVVRAVKIAREILAEIRK